MSGWIWDLYPFGRLIPDGQLLPAARVSRRESNESIPGLLRGFVR